jgi:putative hemolysin
MTTLILIFGEISPKSYAAQNAEKVALKTSGILQFLQVIFKPLLWLFTTISNLVIRIAGGEMRGVTAVVTEEEIMSLVDVGEEEGVVKHQEREMIEGVFEIDEAEVSDIMIQRIDMVAIEDHTSVEEVIALVMEKGHSRIPVYRESIDNIIGIVYAKDLLKIAADAKRDLKTAKLNELLREAYYIPEGKKLSKLLKELQLKKVHMAIVLDEYGGTEGLVTIEDILEEIVGEIFDEYDSEEKKIEQIADNKYIITGDMDLEEVEDAFDVKFSDEDKEDYDSVGGYIFNTLDRVPKNGDKVEHEGLIFIVKKVMKRRVKEVFVEILEKFEEEIEE